MGIPVSLILIAAGLVLALAVHSHSSGVDINTVGWILFAVGSLGLVLTLLFWDSWFGRGAWDRGAPYAEARGYRRGPRRVVVEEDDGPPPPPPY